MKRSFLVIIALLSMAGSILAQSESPREALRQLVERANSGNGKALHDLAYLHETGYDSIPIDSLRSAALYRLSAEAGYAPAQSYLGFLYFNGDRVRLDVDSALYWMAKAAGQGDAKAANNLGFLLSNSDKVSRDYSQAIYWLTKGAEAGLPAAKANLADLYRQGLGAAPDTVAATRLYTEAIESGLQDAELKLLSMMGRKWEQLDGDSALNLGKRYYLRGAPFIGVTLFENAAAKDNAEAFVLLGDAYSRGIGTEYNHDRALENFLHGALAGDPSGMFVVGELLDIFPDALDGQNIYELLLEYFPAGIPDELYDARFWYDAARSKGITDADSAYARLSFNKN